MPLAFAVVHASVSGQIDVSWFVKDVVRIHTDFS